MAFLELKGVCKGFGAGGARHEVLHHVDLAVAKGEFVAVVGGSGAGKTTLISLVAGLLQPDSGAITLAGRRVTGPGPDRGVVFQNYSLLPWMTAFENVLLAVKPSATGRGAAERRAQAQRYLELVNLGAAGHKRPGELSGGMRQRVAVARALAMEPEVLLLDEPLGALDALTRGTLQVEIERIWRQDQRTVLLITNDVDEGILLADRIVPLGAGRVTAVERRGAATLGPAIEVELERPRDRKAVNHDPRFKQLRGRVIESLLGLGRERRGDARAAIGRIDGAPLELGA